MRINILLGFEDEVHCQLKNLGFNIQEYDKNQTTYREFLHSIRVIYSLLCIKSILKKMHLYFFSSKSTYIYEILIPKFSKHIFL